MSLVELMIAMVISVLAIGATLSMTVQHAKLRKVDEEIHLAFAACRNNLEELRSLSSTALLSMDGTGFDVPGRDGSLAGLRAVPGDPDGLPGLFSVTVDQSSGSGDLYLVTASVAWSGSLRRQKFRLETLMGSRP